MASSTNVHLHRPGTGTDPRHILSAPTLEPAEAIHPSVVQSPQDPITDAATSSDGWLLGRGFSRPGEKELPTLYVLGDIVQRHATATSVRHSFMLVFGFGDLRRRLLLSNTV